ncbi:MAG: PolC-type DNA polymerase III [Lachnospiraceae bacterium]
MDEYIALDLETTGLDPKIDKIIEIGAVRVSNGHIKETWQQLINPGRCLNERVTKLTGITDEMLNDAKKVEEVLEDFLQFTGDLPLVGHNILFDYSFMKRACVNVGYSYERDGYDTLKLSRVLLPDFEHKNLKYLCDNLKIYGEGYHRALADALATAKLFEVLKDQFLVDKEDLFKAKRLIYQVKKEKSITLHQKEYLNQLIKCHKIKVTVDIDRLTRNEASRLTDKLIAQYGKLPDEMKEWLKKRNKI